MTGFHQEKINGTSEISADLIDGLNNGHPLSLYIDGIGSHIKPNSKS